MKDIKTKPQGTPKINKNAPKTVSRIPDAVKNIKSVAKDSLIKNTIEKRLDDNSQNQHSERAEVYATENIESAGYNATDIAYHKGKSYAENRINQRIQQAKTKENQSAPQNPNAPDAPKETSDNAPKQRNMQTQQKSAVKTKEEYIKSQKAEISTPDTVKTKENYIKQYSGKLELQNGIKQKPTIQTTKVREPVSVAPDAQSNIDNIKMEYYNLNDNSLIQLPKKVVVSNPTKAQYQALGYNPKILVTSEKPTYNAETQQLKPIYTQDTTTIYEKWKIVESVLS